MLCGGSAPGNAKQPPGVVFAMRDGRAVVKARAGAPGWQPIAALIFSILWAVSWSAGLVRVIGSIHAGTAVNPGPAVFLCSLGALSGIYCAALCVWTMLGNERLVIGKKRLSISNPWLFGLRMCSFELSKLQPFVCSGRECGVQPEEKSCCCRWSAVDYAMSFGYKGRRITVFPQLPPKSKEWLRDRLNHILAKGASQV